VFEIELICKFAKFQVKNCVKDAPVLLSLLNVEREEDNTIKSYLAEC
jgi:hypothetical protein